MRSYAIVVAVAAAMISWSAAQSLSNEVQQQLNGGVPAPAPAPAPAPGIKLDQPESYSYGPCFKERAAKCEVAELKGGKGEFNECVTQAKQDCRLQAEEGKFANEQVETLKKAPFFQHLDPEMINKTTAAVSQVTSCAASAAYKWWDEVSANATVQNNSNSLALKSQGIAVSAIPGSSNVSVGGTECENGSMDEELLVLAINSAQTQMQSVLGSLPSSLLAAQVQGITNTLNASVTNARAALLSYQQNIKFACHCAHRFNPMLTQTWICELKNTTTKNTTANTTGHFAGYAMAKQAYVQLRLNDTFEGSVVAALTSNGGYSAEAQGEFRDQVLIRKTMLLARRVNDNDCGELNGSDRYWNLFDNGTKITSTCYSKTVEVDEYTTHKKYLVKARHIAYNICVGTKCAAKKAMLQCRMCTLANIGANGVAGLINLVVSTWSAGKWTGDSCNAAQSNSQSQECSPEMQKLAMMSA